MNISSWNENGTADLVVEKYIPYYHFVFLIILFIVSFCGNGFLIFAILSKKRLRRPSIIYLLGLSFTDLLFATCFIVSMDAGLHDEWRFGDEMCVINALVVIITGSLSLFHMMIIAVTRSQNICKPAAYAQYDTWKFKITIEALVWIVGVAWVSVPRK